MREIIEYGRTNPAWWVETVLGVRLWSKQIEAISALATHDRVAFKSCHGIGKTLLDACALLWFLYTHVPSVVVSTGPTARQVRDRLWREVGALHRDARIPLGAPAPLTQKLELAKDHFAFGFTAPPKDASRFQGWHGMHILAIVDEAAGIAPAIFEEGVQAILTGGETVKLLMTGNPTSPQGEFYHAFRRDSSTYQISVSAFESPNLTEFGITEEDIASGAWKDKVGDRPLLWPALVSPAWVRDRFEKWGGGTIEGAHRSPRYQSRVLALFPTQGDDSLIALTWVELAKGREVSDEGPLEFGVDVARTGNAETVIAERQGQRGRIRRTWRGLDTVATAAAIKLEAIEAGAATIKIDSIGVGAGVYDQLRRDHDLRAIGISVLECVGSAKAKDPDQYVNARAEWFWLLREAFERGAVAIEEDDELEEQLTAIRWEVDRQGRIKIESKEDMQRRGVESPDRADALAYAFASPSLAAPFVLM